jgi:uncharacterized protein (UPF0332 family)
MPGEYHRYLLDAQEARNIGDYQVVSHLTEEETKQHITHAEQILDAGWNVLRENPDTSGL